jgi:hypothetical protein
MEGNMCQLSDSLENSVEGKSYTKRFNTMGRTNASSSGVSIEWDEQDTWFVTFTFPIVIGTQSAEEKVKEWLRRLRQTLVLKENEVFFSYLLAPQSREIWHVHLIVRALGLGQIDQKRWEGKWTEITGRKVIDELTRHRTQHLPGVIRRRGSEETIVSHVIKSEEEVIGRQTHFAGGGTCKIRQVGQNYLSRRKREYICTLEGVNNYLASRHSREMMENSTFIGIS